MPLAVEIHELNQFCFPLSRQLTRDRLGVSNDAVVFVYAFDPNSTSARTNPLAALEAFQQVFPMPQLMSSQGRFDNNYSLSERMELLIKTFRATSIRDGIV